MTRVAHTSLLSTSRSCFPSPEKCHKVGIREADFEGRYQNDGFFFGKKLGLYTEGSINLLAIGYLRLSFDVYYKSLEANQACVALQNQFLVLPRIPVLCSLYRLYNTPLLTPALLRGNPSVYGELLA